MAFKKDDKNIENLFKEQTQVLPEDKDLKGNAILDDFRGEHGRIMNEHATEYTNLLKGYIINLKCSLNQKKKFKNIFFGIAISMLVASFILFFVISIILIKNRWGDMDITALAGLISSLVGVLSLYIIIPKIIAEYLFNSKEDENMARIVQSIQTYDENVFTNMNLYSFGEKIENMGAKQSIIKLKKDAKADFEDINNVKGNE